MIQDYPLLIGGEWQSSDERIEIRSPYTKETVGTTYLATAEQIDTAILAAKESFQHMSTLPSYKRAEILLQTANEIKTRSEELARLIAAEAGKPLKIARTEVSRAIITFTIAAEESKRWGGELLPLDLEPASEGRIALVRRFPIGPIAAITPFNFPLNLVAHKLAPACATGNTVVLKPAPQTPLTALTLADILVRAGWPEGALSVLLARNEDATPLVSDPRLKMLSFTGSATVGWQLKKIAADRRVVLELGGNAGVAIHSDTDLHWAAARCAVGGFSYAGQSCISVQRIYVHRPVYDEFVTRFLTAVNNLKVGDPMDETTDVGPMISEAEALRIENWVSEACKNGAQLLCGSHRVGSLFEPTVLTGVSPEQRVSCQEVFAPVVTLDTYDEFEEALALIDSSDYGLQAGIFTRDLPAIFRAYQQLKVGGLIVGDIPTYRADHMPYGGTKQSGIGREGIRYAMEEMTELKTLVLKLS
ncbi:MAG: aldehyde dehydrogenase family protein [Acidobacteriota bacterium]